ncbi:CAP domain-containing protein [Bisporella sp. PMI_857]|nr:CAP domain-containing protein [Bisporella sp. PMI_857]
MHFFIPATFLLVTTTTAIPFLAPRAASQAYTNDSKFQSSILAAHNAYRAHHSAPALKWDATLAAFASDYVRPCNFKHSGGPYGENLAAGYANPTHAVNAWGDERRHYNYRKPGFSDKTGHFTQVVWIKTTKVGCGRVACNGKNGVPGYYIACEYSAPGNMGGNNNQYYKDNVKSQKK